MLLTIELWRTKYWMKGLCLLSPVPWWHNVMVSAILTLVSLWSLSSLVTIIWDKDPGAQCGLGNGHQGNVMSSNVVQDLINDQQTSQRMSSWDHQDSGGICVSLFGSRWWLYSAFSKCCGQVAPNSWGQTVHIITNDDKKRSETKYITLHLCNRRFKWVFFSWIFVRCGVQTGKRVISKALFNFKTVCARHFTNVLLIWSSF